MYRDELDGATVLDEAVLQDYFDGDVHLFLVVWSVFDTFVDVTLGRLREALDLQERDALISAASVLKSGLLNLGSGEAAELARKIERCAWRRLPAEATPLWPGLVEAVARFRVQARAFAERLEAAQADAA